MVAADDDAAVEDDRVVVHGGGAEVDGGVVLDGGVAVNGEVAADGTVAADDDDEAANDDEGAAEDEEGASVVLLGCLQVFSCRSREIGLAYYSKHFEHGCALFLSMYIYLKCNNSAVFASSVPPQQTALRRCSWNMRTSLVVKAHFGHG